MIPDLPAPYDAALQSSLEWLHREYDIVAILVCGTVIRGQHDQSSDLDLHVLHRGAFRERVQRFFEGVPCEIFVNPPTRIARYFEEERSSRRPCTAHMFATGVIIHDPEGAANELVALAKTFLKELPEPPNPEAQLRSRYGAATAFEDALDLADRDSSGAALLLAWAVFELVRCRLEEEGGWIPRQKDFLAELKRLDPDQHVLATSALEGPLDHRFEFARKLCVSVTGSTGFFEWRSEREQVS